MAQTRIVLHAGVGKTGTSALQSFFALNREVLAARGVHYPAGPSDEDAADGKVTSGNGVDLACWLSDYYRTRFAAGEREAIWQRVLDGLAAAPAGTHTVLYSCEHLQFAAPERLAALRERLTGLGYAVSAVVFVRHVEDWLASHHQQMVKRNRCTLSLEDYAGQTTVTMAGTVADYDRVLGPAAVTVLSYDLARADLTGYFLAEALGMAAEGFRALPATEVNRSLTAFELDVLRSTNQLVTGARAHRWAWTITEQLYAVSAGRGGRTQPRPHLPAELLERYRPDVDFLNSRLRAGRVLLATSRPDPAAASPLDHLVEATQDAALLHAVTLANLWVRTNETVALRRRVRQLDQQVQELAARLDEAADRRERVDPAADAAPEVDEATGSPTAHVVDLVRRTASALPTGRRRRPAQRPQPSRTGSVSRLP